MARTEPRLQAQAGRTFSGEVSTGAPPRGPRVLPRSPLKARSPSHPWAHFRRRCSPVTAMSWEGGIRVRVPQPPEPSRSWKDRPGTPSAPKSPGTCWAGPTYGTPPVRCAPTARACAWPGAVSLRCPRPLLGRPGPSLQVPERPAPPPGKGPSTGPKSHGVRSGDLMAGPRSSEGRGESSRVGARVLPGARGGPYRRGPRRARRTRAVRRRRPAGPARPGAAAAAAWWARARREGAVMWHLGPRPGCAARPRPASGGAPRAPQESGYSGQEPRRVRWRGRRGGGGPQINRPGARPAPSAGDGPSSGPATPPPARRDNLNKFPAEAAPTPGAWMGGSGALRTPASSEPSSK